MHDLERRVLAWFLVILCLVSSLLSEDCVYYFTSSAELQRGTFHSPFWPRKYANNIQCIYKFIGRTSERVKITFTSFSLQGVPPMCEYDYVDLYAQVNAPSQNLLDVPLTGRFCGDTLEIYPSIFISTHNIIVLNFYSDSIRNDLGFNGTFEFLDASVYQIGTEAPPNICGYTIRSEHRKDGYIMSPTYPGMYPDNIFCYYKLEGKPRQRIKLTFIDFDFFHGGNYCPFDYLKIYDGHNKDATVIGIFCGKYKGLTIYSTKESLYLELVTRSGRIDFDTERLENIGDFTSTRRGFNITYEFSHEFVNLDFIAKDASHIIGTECDQRIVSNSRTNGTFRSPGYPFHYPINVSCRYYLDGMMDRDHLEKVRVQFLDFNITGSMPYCSLGYVAANLKGQVGDHEHDEKFCGPLYPPALTSSDPRLILIFNTTNGVLGQGFLAAYEFLTDFAISGKQVQEGICKFIYSSNKVKSGQLNSPWHPGTYPVNVDCEYEFIPEPGEKIRIYFNIFKMPLGDESCVGNDNLEIYEYTRGLTNGSLIGQYCQDILPGPLLSSDYVTKWRMLFHSDMRHVDMGFKAQFEFIRPQDILTDCGKHVISDGTGGVIKSPNHPENYDPNMFCEWVIQTSKPGNKILLEFPKFLLEGKIKSNCQKAILRLYYGGDQPVTEMCGKQEAFSLISDGDLLKLTFTSARLSMGAAGFAASWTEIQTNSPGKCTGFRCEKTGYCIARQLLCNDIPNCGRGDNSDEDERCKACQRNTSPVFLVYVMSLLCFLLISSRHYISAM